MPRVVSPPGVVTVAQGDGTSNSLVSVAGSAAFASASAWSCWVTINNIVNEQPICISDGTSNNYVTVYAIPSAVHIALGRGGSPILDNALSITPAQLAAYGWLCLALSVSAAGATVWGGGTQLYSTSTDSHLTLGATPSVTFCGRYGIPYRNYIAEPAIYTSLSHADATAIAAGERPATRPGHVESWPMCERLTATSLAGVNGHTATLGSTTKLVTNLLRVAASGRVAVSGRVASSGRVTPT